MSIYLSVSEIKGGKENDESPGIIPVAVAAPGDSIEAPLFIITILIGKCPVTTLQGGNKMSDFINTFDL